MKKQITNIFIRYLILLLVAIPNLYLFYKIFTPLTLYSVYFILDIFFEPGLILNMIYLPFLKLPVVLIPACIAGSAYYLLLILNLSISNIKIKKRITMILYAFAALLIFNILRIFFLILLADSSMFEITHKFFWYFLSTIFVVLIWFSEVKLFKIKQIPFYSDFKFLYKQTK
ncbi:pacearchaeosortase [archaeon]|jgi:exosortase/archaeosortase family protein|nr:pacearchaeosortase [archaeon]MBT4373235.1 pacearchaeosortase [archaeon]MBT4531580.1 pacearchaeosortase [archaeon]MBT7001242.1 pacearchaeosortase [archaeon]MBT7282272.1 pacearchaeosortase [archaeon]